MSLRYLLFQLLENNEKSKRRPGMAFFKDNTHFMNMKTAKMKLLLSSLSKCKRQFFARTIFAEMITLFRQIF